MDLLPSVFVALMPQGMDFVWILLIILLLFGGAKLPSLARGLGQSIKEFKKASTTDDEKEPEVKKAETTKTPGPN